MRDRRTGESAEETSSDELLESALGDFIAAWESGEKPDPDAFAAARPGIARGLRERIELFLRVTPLFGPLPDPPPARPETIGPYRILGELGRGGMGAVYLAEQKKPIQRKVALKLIKAGLDTKQVVSRFEAEREALALMSHPNVARVFDAGETADGRPYFVMEHIPGVPITTYCDEARLHTGDRLKLFLETCDAIRHAHQKGIIHRDVKPSNVLVMLQDGRPVPKVIDFGVAKATHGRLGEGTLETGIDQLVGTPEYMSPEQAELGYGSDVDTRTDVYGLGVLLYEMLTGALPFESKTLRGLGLSELRRRIREEEPAKPSTRVTGPADRFADAAANRRSTVGALRRQLRGDLDWITMKALEKDRTRRYASVSDLADDVRRHIAGVPVEAGPPTIGYRLRKYARRHRAPLLVSAVLAAAAALSLVLTFDARRARSDALLQETIAEKKALEAERERDKNARFADAQRLADAIARADELWPAEPARREEMAAWIETARELASRLGTRRSDLEKLRESALPWSETARQRDFETHPLQDELIGMQAQLASLRREIGVARAAGNETTAFGSRVATLEKNAADGESRIAALEESLRRRRTWEFATFEESWRHESLSRLVSGLESLVHPKTGLIADMEARLEFARTVEARSIGDHVAAWDEAIEGVARDPRFDGLELRPQIGLVPLGADPKTGLFEFAHLASGRVPARGKDGALEVDEETGIVLVLTPGGTFRMGSPEDETGHEHDESPAHDMTLDPFFVSKHEMTQGQWFRLTGKNPSFGRPGAAFGGKTFSLRNPVENVTWHECDLVLRRQGLVLPTEAQWECAARAGTTTAWSSGSDPESLHGHANLADLALARAGYAAALPLESDGFDDGHGLHAPVGSFAPNPWGLHDVHGNVLEWCRDRLVQYDLPARRGDGERRISESPARTQRGGGADGGPLLARSAFRNSSSPDSRSQFVGVRPARVAGD